MTSVGQYLSLVGILASKPTLNGGNTCHAISVPMECRHSMQLEQSWSSTVAIIERLYGSGKDVLGKIVFVLRDKGQYHSPSLEACGLRGSRMVLPQIPQNSASIHQYVLTRVTIILSMMAILQDQKCSNEIECRCSIGTDTVRHLSLRWTPGVTRRAPIMLFFHSDFWLE